jgi:hypothetical protein
VSQTQSLLREIKAGLGVVRVNNKILGPVELISDVRVHIPWDKHRLEKEFNIKIPIQLEEFWNISSELILMRDLKYGSYGLKTFPPNDVLKEINEKIYNDLIGQEDFRKGDLIIGELFAEDDKLIIRCDPDQHDFGKVIVAVPIDPRRDWPGQEYDLDEFLRLFVDNKGLPFWL